MRLHEISLVAYSHAIVIAADHSLFRSLTTAALTELPLKQEVSTLVWSCAAVKYLDSHFLGVMRRLVLNDCDLVQRAITLSVSHLAWGFAIWFQARCLTSALGTPMEVDSESRKKPFRTGERWVMLSKRVLFAPIMFLWHPVVISNPLHCYLLAPLSLLIEGLPVNTHPPLSSHFH